MDSCWIDQFVKQPCFTSGALMLDATNCKDPHQEITRHSMYAIYAYIDPPKPPEM